MLPVFASVFMNYLDCFSFLTFVMQLITGAIFPIGLAIINIIGVKAAVRLNDVPTIIKITPLFLIRLLGTVSILIYPNLTKSYSPIAHRALNNFGVASVLIFWAYAGFELLHFLPAK